MAREQWAKVDVDTPIDEKLFGRPLLERYLWMCLICLSKKNWIETGDYTIHNLDAAALNSRFNLGSTPAVEKGLKYFETCEPRPMIKRRDGSIFLLNIEKRQAKSKDNPEAHRERQARYRERNRDGDGDGSGQPSLHPSRDPSPNSESTRHGARHQVSPRDADEDEDLDQDEDQITKQIADPAARAPVPWPPDLLEQLRVALRRQLETNDREWANFIRDTSVQFPLDRRIRAAQAFLQRMKPGQSYRPAYVFAMIRDGAEPTKSESNGPPSTDSHEDHHAATQRMLAAKKANADQAVREREEAKAKGVPSAATKALDKVLGRRPNGSPRT